MDASIDGAITRIEHAYEHFEGLRAEFLARRQDNTYGVFAQVDPQTGEMVFRVRFPYALRLRWAASIGDIVHDLRSGLDQLAHQLVLLNKAKPGGDTQFPVFSDVVQYGQKAGPMIHGMSKEARTLIEAAQPYHAGKRTRDHPLALLNRLSNWDKHRLPNVSVIKSKSGTLTRSGAPQKLPGDPILSDGVDDAEWFRVPDGVNVKYGLEMQIAFKEGKPAFGVEVEETLGALIKYVQLLTEQAFGPLFPIQRRLWRFNVEMAVLPTTTRTGGCPLWQVDFKSVTRRGLHMTHASPGHPDCEFPQIEAEANP